MKKLTDLTCEVSLKFTDELVELALNEFLDVICIEGSLLDSYAIINDKHIKIGRAKPRDYIIISEEYATPWTSKLVLTQTDNEELYNDFYREWSFYQDTKNDNVGAW